MILLRCAKATPYDDGSGYWEVVFDSPSTDRFYILAEVILDYATGQPWVVVAEAQSGVAGYDYEIRIAGMYGALTRFSAMSSVLLLD